MREYKLDLSFEDRFTLIDALINSIVDEEKRASFYDEISSRNPDAKSIADGCRKRVVAYSELQKRINHL